MKVKKSRLERGQGIASTRKVIPMDSGQMQSGSDAVEIKVKKGDLKRSRRTRKEFSMVEGLIAIQEILFSTTEEVHKREMRMVLKFSMFIENLKINLHYLYDIERLYFKFPNAALVMP